MIIKSNLTFDEIDELFDENGGIDGVIDILSQHNSILKDIELQEDILHEEDEMRIISTGYYYSPAQTNPKLPNNMRNVRIYPAIMLALRDSEWETDASVSVITDREGNTLYWETESYESCAIHNYFGLDMNKISHLRFNLCI